MAESIEIPVEAGREEKYRSLIPQLKALLTGETDLVANAANAMALLNAFFGFHWTGVYFVRGDELVLGPFQGPVACTRIKRGRGVCGSAWAEERTIIVPNVDLFPGHIACSALSKSEIVVPIRDGEGKIIGVIDIDSILTSDFSLIDQEYLEQIAEMLGTSFSE